ncbi:hypothetical protein VTP01DRAFT_6307 [Rhizomucor pusillus]|uniref:uncharacterized protein n=1 Tax=Rhizomucor pusillus TaxID=4840 RepID=UPI0037443C54
MRSFLGVLITSIVFFIADAFAQRYTYQGVATMMEYDGFHNASLVKRAGRGTWYNGNDLKNAACYDRNGYPEYDATIHDMIGAMAMDTFEECYKCVEIRNNNNKKLKITVMIVDKCAACQVGKAIDLTPSAFSMIAPHGSLDIGVLDISWKPVPCKKMKKRPHVPKKHGKHEKKKHH